MGYIMVLIQCTISAIASIYTEWLLKSSSQSIHLQNVQLYTYGTLFGLAALAAKGLTPVDLLMGWNAATYFSMGLLAFSGLAVSAVMKYADNLVKVFATAGSMFLTSGLSAIIFGTPIYWTQLAGALVASAALFIYASSPPPTDAAPTELHRHSAMGVPGPPTVRSDTLAKIMGALTSADLSTPTARRMGG